MGIFDINYQPLMQVFKGGHSVIGRGNSVITAAKFGYRDRITENRQKLPNYRRLKAFPDDLGLGNFSRRLSQKVVFTLNSEDDFCRKSSSLFQSEDDIHRKSSSLFKVKMTFCESRLHSSKLPRLELPIFGGFLPNYQDRDQSFDITETDYRAHMLATVPTFAGVNVKMIKNINKL